MGYKGLLGRLVNEVLEVNKVYQVNKGHKEIQDQEEIEGTRAV